jgi:type IV pilus assembly protein PilW
MSTLRLKLQRPHCPSIGRGGQSGLSLVELMVSITIGLLILAALVALFVNTSGSNRELARANSLIENGRLAIQLLESDVVHAGFWGTHVPEFDDQTSGAVPTDVPNAVPDPCQAFDPGVPVVWTNAYRANVIGIPVQAYEDAAVCAGIITNKLAGTDVLVVRHAELCVPGEATGATGAGTCEADVAGNLYMQSSLCDTDLAPYVLDTTGFTLLRRNCTTAAEKRKYMSSIYFVRNYAVTPGDGIPTLMRSQFARSAGGALEHQPAVAMIEGIDGFRVELGIDNRSKAYAGNPTGTPVNYTQAIAWADPNTRTIPTNRGDGSPDGAFVRCTTAVPCTAAQLMNVTAVRISVLVRSREASPGFTDTKTYAMAGGTTMGPFNDQFKRHVFTTTVRLPNVSGRRATP